MNCIGVQAVVDAIGKLDAIYAKNQPLGNTQVCEYMYVCMYVWTFVNTPSHFHCMMKHSLPFFVRV